MPFTSRINEICIFGKTMRLYANAFNPRYNDEFHELNNTSHHMYKL